MIQRMISWCFLVAAMGFLLNLEVRGAEPLGVRKLPGQQIRSSREAVLLYRDAANFQNNHAFELAVDEWQRFLERYPEDPLAPKVRHYLGVCLLQLEQYQRAADAFQEVVAKHPESSLRADALYALGVTYQELEQWVDAGSVYGLYLKEFGENPLAVEVRFRKAETAARAGEYQRAADGFQEVVANHPEFEAIEDAYWNLGYCQYTLARTGAEGMYAKAAETFAALLKKYPESSWRADALYALGVTYQELEQWPNAGSIYDLYLKEFDENPLAVEVRFRKAETAARAGEYQRAADGFQEVVANHPEFEAIEDAYWNLGHCQYTLAGSGAEGMYAKAAETFAALLKKFPESSWRADALYALGVTYQELEQWADAGSIYDLYLKEFGENPLAVEVRFRKAETVLHAGEYAVAAAAFTAVATDHPNHELAPRAWHNSGVAWFQQHAYIPAIDALTRAIELAPDAGSFLWRGIARYATADYGSALDDLTRAIDFPLDLEADRLIALEHRGRTWHARQEFDRADADFTAALRLKPSDAARFAELHFERGRTRYAAGSIEDAARDFQEAIRMASPFPDAHRQLAACWVQLGFLDHAERQYATAWEQEQDSANASPAPVLWLGRRGTPIALERLGNYRLARTAAPSAR